MLEFYGMLPRFSFLIRQGKVSITQLVHPGVRKQVHQLVLDHDKEQCELVTEALNLLFERYGKPPIA